MEQYIKYLYSVCVFLLRITGCLVVLIPLGYSLSIDSINKNFIVKGNLIVDRSEIIEKISVNLFDNDELDILKIKKHIQSIDYIHSCSIYKINSNQVLVRVEESVPIASINLDGNKKILDQYGNFIKYNYNFSINNLNQIVAIDTPFNVISSKNNQLINIIEFIKKNQILLDDFTVSFNDSKISVYDKNKIILLGSNSFVDKLFKLKVFIDKYGENYNYIDFFNNEYIIAK